MRILIVNGIFTHGAGSVDRMVAPLEALGHQCVDVHIPIRDIFACRLEDKNAADAWRVLCAHKPGDAVVAHSRGALVTHYALRAGARFSRVFLFAPAMESDVPWPAGAGHIHVIHNPDDPALHAGTCLINHPFGDLGLTGYDGPFNECISNFQQHYPGHSDYFKPAEIDRWVRYVTSAFRVAP